VKTRLTLTRPPIVLLISLVVLSVLTLARFDQSLWLDEGSSVWFARLPFGTLLNSLCDPHPPGYYLLLKIWLIAGESEAWLRALSLLAALLAVGLTYQIGKEHGGQECAGLAALLLALQPLQSWYGSEVRMYALAQAAGLALVWLGWRIIAGAPRRRLILFYLLAAMAALWVDYTALLPWGLLQLIWIARGSPHARRWIALQAIVLLPSAIGLFTTSQLAGLRQNYQPIFLALQANNVGLPLTPASAALILQGAVLLAVLASFALALYWRRHQFLGSQWSRSVVVGLWIVLVALSIVPYVFTLKRMLIVLLPYLALVVAYVLMHWPRTAAHLLIAVEVVAALISLFTLQRQLWREIVTEIVSTDQSTSVWVDDLAAPVFDYYARRAAPPDRAVSWTPLFGRDLPQTPGLPSVSNGTLTLLVTDTPYRNLMAFLPKQFYAEYDLVSEQHALGLSAYRFRQRAQPQEAAAPFAPAPNQEWGLLLPSPLTSCTP
jgi:hypothetical protein